MKAFYETNEFQVLRELHFNSRREGATGTPTVRVADLVSFKGWSKNKARRILKAMTDSGLLYKWGKRGAQVIWRWTGDGVTAFHEGRKVMWAANPLTPEEEASTARVVAACREADKAASGPAVHVFATTSEAYDACQWNDEIKTGDVLVCTKEKVVGLAGAWPVAVTPEAGSFHQSKGDVLSADPKFTAEGVAKAEAEIVARGWTEAEKEGFKVQARWQAEAIVENEGRTFDDSKSYCKQCFSVVDLWDDTDEGYTNCCNKRAVEATEAREINASELKYLKGETE